MTYKIKLEIFEGPLDLLLYLVKQNHLEIDAIPIAQITDQYLQYLELMKALDLEIAGEFLVMAATLMQIKSRMLLPREEGAVEEEEEEDPTQALIERLKEYQRYKEAAEALGGMEKTRLVQYSRSVPSSGDPAETEETVEATLFDLLTAFSQFMAGELSRELIHEVIQDEHTVEQKIDTLRTMTSRREQISFTELFAKIRSKMEMVAIFLALLELIRLKEVLVRQHQTFGHIHIVRNAAPLAAAPQEESAAGGANVG